MPTTLAVRHLRHKICLERPLSGCWRLFVSEWRSAEPLSRPRVRAHPPELFVEIPCRRVTCACTRRRLRSTLPKPSTTMAEIPPHLVMVSRRHTEKGMPCKRSPSIHIALRVFPTWKRSSSHCKRTRVWGSSRCKLLGLLPLLYHHVFASEPNIKSLSKIITAPECGSP